VGTPSVSLSEAFDAITAPALPAGWTATALTGAVAPWQTVTTTVHTAPNAAFAPDPNFVSDNVLVDGAVLEIKIGGGVFTDVVSAGGSFVTGGYDKVVSTSYSNPLAGRMAWTGNSGGYRDTLVNLPAAAAGQTVQLRWRVGTDSSVPATGQRLDTLLLMDGFTCSAAALAPVV
jgi:hypothetical protein